MGNGYSHQKEWLKKLYEHYRKHHVNSSGKAVGGDEKIVGGYSALQQYGDSIFSKAKEELIRGLAKDVSSILGAKGVENGPIESVIRKFKEVLPRPGTGKGTLRADAGKHAKLCLMLAKAINRRYDQNVIDETAEPHMICQRVAELMYSLFTGLHTEFLTVAGDVSRIVKNLEVLQGIVDSANQKIMNDLAGSADGMLSTEAETSKELYRKISDEIRRQHVMLSNIVNSSIGPVGSSLIGILSDNKDFTGLVEDLKRSTGTVFFGDRLAHLLSGISSISHSAHLVDKALKDIGMSVSEYKNTKGIKELRDKVYTAIAGKKPSSKELTKLMVAADILYRNDMAHDDIAKYLTSKTGSSEVYGGDDMDPSEASFADMADDVSWTDSSKSPFIGRTQSYRHSISKQLRDQKKYRNLLFSDFNSQIKANYAQFINALAKISGKVGGEIQTTDKLALFIRLLNNFAKIQPERKNLHIALSGYRSDSASNYIKYQYMDYLDILKEEAQSLSNGSGGQYFREIATILKNLIKTIDEFNMTFVKSLSDVGVNDAPRHRGGIKPAPLNEGMLDVQVADIEKMGGEDGEAHIDVVVGGGALDSATDILGGVIKSFDDLHFKHFKTLKKSIRELDYFFRIAHIKSAMKKAANENKSNVENYENVLGEEAGFLIDQINRKYNALVENATTASPQLTKYGYATGRELLASPYSPPDVGAVAAGGPDNHNIFGDGVLRTAFEAGDNKNLRDGYLFLLEYIRSAKVEMLEAAQSIDLYLSQFTQKIEQEPDTIKNLVDVLEQLEIVAKWFTDKSGDNLAGVFEAFPREFNAGASPLPVANDFKHGFGLINNSSRNNLTSEYSMGGNHYYETVSGAGADNKVGVSYFPILLDRNQAIQFVKQIERSIKGVRALENIVNIFNKVNSHSSGEIRTFMNAGLVFKALMKYCVASVIGIGIKTFVVNGNRVAANNPERNTYIGGDQIVVNHLLFSNGATADARANHLGGDPTGLPVGATAERIIMRYHAGVTLRLCNEVVLATTLDAGGQHARSILQLCDPFQFAEDKNSRSSITDKIFEMCIKSMVTKVFVVVGSYSLFNRPPKSNQLYASINQSYSVNPLRQIMGGSAKAPTGGRETIQVIPEAVELYIRLPLLTEWYRKVFEFTKDGNVENETAFTKQNDPLVSIIPEMDNIWRDLCFSIFIDAANVDEGGYPTDIAHRIVKSITEIYSHYKSKKPSVTCHEIIQDFVVEINRRYGFMKRAEINNYLDAHQSMIRSGDSNYPDDGDNVDYDLLNADDEFGRRIAPSDRFKSFNVSKRNSREALQVFYRAVRRFRQSIEANLLLESKVDPNGVPMGYDLSVGGDTSMDQIIRVVNNKLDKAKTEEEKYEVIHAQLHGIQKYSNLDQNRLLIFHELVINPLTILYFVYLILNDYNKFMVSMNLEKWDKVIDDVTKETPVGARVATEVKLHGFDAANVDHGGLGGGVYFTSFAAGAGNGTPVANHNSSGHIHLMAALQLLHYNNKNYKGTSAQAAYGLPEEDYKAHVHGMCNVEQIIRYFKYGRFDALYAKRDAAGLYNHVKDEYTINSRYPLNYQVFGIYTDPGYDDGGGAVGGITNDQLLNTVTAANKYSLTHARAMLRRFLLDSDRLMEDTMRRIMNISCELNGLVEVYFAGGDNKMRYPSINFDKLEDVCSKLLQLAKQSLTKLRKSLPASILASVEVANEPGKTNPNVVSIFYLQEHLFDRLFKNRYGNGLDGGNSGLKHIWIELTRDHGFNMIKGPIIGGAITREVINVKNGFGNAQDVKYNVFGETRELNGSFNFRLYDAKFCNFPASAAELRQNLRLQEQLHSEYRYTSFNQAFSKLLFWNVSSDYDTKHLSQCLGFRDILFTNESSQFPAHYMPLFKNEDSFATQRDSRTKEFKTSTDVIGPGGGGGTDAKNIAGLEASGLDSKVVNVTSRVVNNSNATVKAGITNIYDYGNEYSNITGLEPRDATPVADVGAAYVNNNPDRTAMGSKSIDNAHDELTQHKLYNYTSELGMISKLNNILYHYMITFMDKGTKKIYKPLIEKFVNGFNSKDILSGKNINEKPVTASQLTPLAAGAAAGAAAVTNPLIADSTILREDKYATQYIAEYTAVANYTPLGNYMNSALPHLEIPDNSVLFSSLASAIKTIYTSKLDKMAGMVSMFMEDNLSNVPEYQKELMRAYLPIFEKQLEMLIKRADIIKSAIDATGCKVYKPIRHWSALAGYNSSVAAAGGVNPAAQEDEMPFLFDTAGKLLSNGNNIHANFQFAVRVYYNSVAELNSNYTQPLRTPEIESESARKSYLLNMASNIVVSARSLLSCINSVQKELADIPLYFETYKDSIVDFNNRNGKLPLMPLSMVTHLMNFNLHRVDKSGNPIENNDMVYDLKDPAGANFSIERTTKYNVLLVPSKDVSVGSTKFKVLYGTRGLLSHKQKPLVDYVPTMLDILNVDKSSNKLDGAINGFTKDFAQKATENIVLLSRFVLDYMYHVQYLDRHGYDQMRKLIVDAQRCLKNAAGNAVISTEQAPAERSVTHLACQTSKYSAQDSSTTRGFWSKPNSVLALVENENVNQALTRMTSCIRADSNNSLFDLDRHKLRIYNILDLNVVPINFHSLQREIPFINLINYSYTFDHIIKNTIGVASKNIPLYNIHGIPPEHTGNDGDNAAGAPYTSSNNDGKDSKYISAAGEQCYSLNEYMSTIHPEDQLVRYMIHPIGFRRLHEYVNDVYKIMAGNTSLSLNRPKYLSDQLWNKVLLNNLYDSTVVDTSSQLAASRSAQSANTARGIPSLDDICRATIASITTDQKFIDTARKSIALEYENLTLNIAKRLVKILAVPGAAHALVSAGGNGIKMMGELNILRLLRYTLFSTMVMDKKFQLNQAGAADNEATLTLQEMIAAYNEGVAINTAIGSDDKGIDASNGKINPVYFFSDFIHLICGYQGINESILKYKDNDIDANNIVADIAAVNGGAGSTVYNEYKGQIAAYFNEDYDGTAKADGGDYVRTRGSDAADNPILVTNDIAHLPDSATTIGIVASAESRLIQMYKQGYCREGVYNLFLAVDPTKTEKSKYTSAEMTGILVDIPLVLLGKNGVVIRDHSIGQAFGALQDDAVNNMKFKNKNTIFEFHTAQHNLVESLIKDLTVILNGSAKYNDGFGKGGPPRAIAGNTLGGKYMYNYILSMITYGQAADAAANLGFLPMYIDDYVRSRLPDAHDYSITNGDRSANKQACFIKLSDVDFEITRNASQTVVSESTGKIVADILSKLIDYPNMVREISPTIKDVHNVDSVIFQIFKYIHKRYVKLDSYYREFQYNVSPNRNATGAYVVNDYKSLFMITKGVHNLTGRCQINAGNLNRDYLDAADGKCNDDTYLGNSSLAALDGAANARMRVGLAARNAIGLFDNAARADNKTEAEHGSFYMSYARNSALLTVQAADVTAEAVTAPAANTDPPNEFKNDAENDTLPRIQASDLSKSVTNYMHILDDGKVYSSISTRNRRPVEVNGQEVVHDGLEPFVQGITSVPSGWIANTPFLFPIVRRLTYMQRNGREHDVLTPSNDVNKSALQHLGLQGYYRYNTRLVRWIEWISHVQRALRIIMRQQLDWVQDPVVQEHSALAEGVTEYSPDNRGYMLEDFE
jgi:hypothetical protein